MLSKDDAERAAQELLAAETGRLHATRDRRRARFLGFLELFCPELRGLAPAASNEIVRLGMQRVRAIPSTALCS